MSIVFLLSLAEDDRDVAGALLNARGAPHRARTPAAQVLVGRLVDERGLDEEAIDVDVRAARLRVRDGALDELLDEGRRRLPSELEQLQRLTRLTAADEIHDDTRLARTDPREPGGCLADHDRSLVARCRTHGHRAILLAARAVTDG